MGRRLAALTVAVVVAAALRLGGGAVCEGVEWLDGAYIVHLHGPGRGREGAVADAAARTAVRDSAEAVLRVARKAAEEHLLLHLQERQSRHKGGSDADSARTRAMEQATRSVREGSHRVHTLMLAFELIVDLPQQEPEGRQRSQYGREEGRQRVLDAVRGMSGVKDVEQQKRFRALSGPPVSWGLDRLDQRDLPLDNGPYSPAYNGSGTSIYVVDTGIDLNHVAFNNTHERDTANMYCFPGYCPSGLDNDTDEHFHGTHVAGTAAGVKYGVSPQANLYGSKCLDDAGDGTTFSVLSGIDAAAGHCLSAETAAAPNPGPRCVINLSVGGDCGQSFCVDGATDSVNAAVDLGIVVSIAAGNDAIDACGFSPAAAVKAITVAATRESDDTPNFNDFGRCVDMLAPGAPITSACAFSNCGTETDSKNAAGTSMAAPHVAGVAAQLLQAMPTATPHEILHSMMCDASKNKISTAQDLRNLLVHSPEPPAANFTPTCDMGAGCMVNASLGNCSFATDDANDGELAGGTCDTVNSSRPFCRCFPHYDASSDCGTYSGPTPAPTPLCATPLVQVDMVDAFGDGWQGAELDFILNDSSVFTAALATGSEGTTHFCPPQLNATYSVESSKGSWPAEVWWRLPDCIGGQTGALTGGAKLASGPRLFIDETGQCTALPPQCNPSENRTLINITLFSAGSLDPADTIYVKSQTGPTKKFYNRITHPDEYGGSLRQMCVGDGVWDSFLISTNTGGLSGSIDSCGGVPAGTTDLVLSHGTCTPPTQPPSLSPTESPTLSPTDAPTKAPSQMPTSYPTTAPTKAPSTFPTTQPSSAPSSQPSAAPSISPAPSSAPSGSPTWSPLTSLPTASPSATPTVPPSPAPTTAPTADPSTLPTGAPSFFPTVWPTSTPTATPTWSPSMAPSPAVNDDTGADDEVADDNDGDDDDISGNDDNGGGSGLSDGEIGGIVVGSVVGVSVLAALLVLFVKHDDGDDASEPKGVAMSAAGAGPQ